MDFLMWLLTSVDIDSAKDLAEKFFGHQFTQMTLAFMAASFIHSGRIKKEIKLAFVSLTSAIDNVAERVTNELSGIKKEIKNLDERVGHIEKKVGEQ